MKKLKLVSIFVVLGFFAMAFQNCGGSPEEIDLSGIIDNGGVVSGVQLYNTNCAGCHGALASSTKSGRSATQITNALNTIPNMSNIQLSASQIQAIADAL